MLKKKFVIQAFVVLILVCGNLYAQDTAEEHYNKGRDYQVQKMYSEAIVEFEEAIRITPNYAEAYDSLGWLYMNTGEIEKGVAYLQKNIEMNPNYAPAYTSIGLILYNDGKGNIGKTREYFLKAKELYKSQGNYVGEQEVDEFLNRLP